MTEPNQAELVADACDTIALIANNTEVLPNGENLVTAHIAEALCKPGAVQYVEHIVKLMGQRWPDNGFHTPENVNWFMSAGIEARRLADNEKRES
jgi:hypothetical protein